MLLSRTIEHEQSAQLGQKVDSILVNRYKINIFSQKNKNLVNNEYVHVYNDVTRIDLCYYN